MSFTKDISYSKLALPTIADFFNTHVEHLPTSSLSSDDSCCHVCQLDFELSLQLSDSAQVEALSYFDELPHPEPKKDVDEPLRLPCGHILGSSCLRKWFSTTSMNTCPLCKRELFAMGSTLEDPKNEEYARRYKEVENTSLRRLMAARWTDEDVVWVSWDVDSIAERLATAMATVAASLQGRKDCLSGQKSRVQSRSTADVHNEICKTFETLAGQELKPADILASVLRRAGEMPEEIRPVVELSTKAVIEYERLIGNLDLICSEE